MGGVWWGSARVQEAWLYIYNLFGFRVLRENHSQIDLPLLEPCWCKYLFSIYEWGGVRWAGDVGGI